jgi:hypothetical protein
MRKLSFPFLKDKKCRVRVITDEEGGNTYFFNTLSTILKQQNITIPIYPKYITQNKKKFRPNKKYKPKINYYP